MQPLQNQNLELVLAVVLKTGTAAVLLGTLCFFVFFFNSVAEKKCRVDSKMSGQEVDKHDGRPFLLLAK